MTASLKRKPGSIALALLFALAVPALAQQPSDGSADDSLATGSLTFWVSCRLKSDAEGIANARAVALHADYPDLKIQYKAFYAGEFLPARSAAGKTGGDPPDIVYVETGAQGPPPVTAGVIVMVGKPRVASPGGWLVPMSSPNPKLARAFILWLEQPPPDRLAKLETQLLTADDATQIRKAASAAVEAFGAAHKGPGVDVLDQGIADFAWDWTGPRPPGFGQQQSFVAATDIVGGNQRFAFAEVSALEQGDNFYGLHHAAVLLRKQGTAWQVVLLQPEESYPDALKLLQNLDTLHLNNDPPSGVAYLSLLAPLDQARVSRYPRLQLEIEQEGELGSMLGIESQDFSADRKMWSPVAFMLLQNGTKPEHILHVPAPFGAGRQPHRWRVWSINQSGAVTLSDWRTMEFTY